MIWKVILTSCLLAFLANPQTDNLKESMERGAVLYEDFCITCHMHEGQGVPGAFPPLAGSDYLLKNRERSIRAVKFGQEGEIEVNGKKYNTVMPNPYLATDEIADVMNFILNSWGNKGPLVTEDEVKAIEKSEKK